MPSATRSIELTEAKQALRRAIREQLRQLRPEKAQLDAKLLARLKVHPWVQAADTVLLYYAVGDEPDTRQFLTWLAAQGIPAALPVCGKDGSMQFCLYHGELVKGTFGIPVPPGRESPVLTEHTLCLVPGMAFSPDGKRLGRGGGYYDRFLAAHTGLRTAGVTYRCLLRETIPCEIHDCRVDTVITEE